MVTSRIPWPDIIPTPPDRWVCWGIRMGPLLATTLGAGRSLTGADALRIEVVRSENPGKHQVVLPDNLPTCPVYAIIGPPS